MLDKLVEWWLPEEVQNRVANTRAAKSSARLVRSVAAVFSKALDLLACIALAGLMLIITADVIGRDAFKHSVPSSIEIAQYYLMVPVVFFSLAAADHIRVELLTSRLPPRYRRITGVFAVVVGVVFMGLMSWKSAETMIQVWKSGEIIESYLQLPLLPPRVIIFLGSALFFLKLVVVFLKGSGEGQKEAH